jgi:hypothetical protein
VTLDTYGNKPLDTDNDGKTRSVLDIPGATLIITELNDELSRLNPELFRNKLKTAQAITIEKPFEKIRVHGQTAYRYVFPVPKYGKNP